MPDENVQQGQDTVGEFVIPAEITDLNLLPATEVKPEDVGTLTLAYKDGAPVLTLSGGTVAPVVLTVVDESGSPVGLYSAGSLPFPVRPTARVCSEVFGSVRVEFDRIDAAPGE
ncbi:MULTISPECIES: hypothetical protein [Streptomyces]|uniref:Uncharacterized protein n=1 Tax=Streptomyces flaveolus TaxID=67297 RepID=A0ABV1VT50_9ACTN